MTTRRRSLFGASLPRTQQFIILVLGLGLSGLWAWRAGMIGPPSTAAIQPQQQYFLEIRGDLPRPGVHVFASPPTVQHVWEAAGGLGTVPNSSQSLTSGTKIMVSSEGTVTLEKMAGQDLLTLGLGIDLNRATAADLEAVPGLGPVLAERIVQFRAVRGPFHHIDDVLDVKGMGPKVLEKIRPYVVIIANADKNP